MPAYGVRWRLEALPEWMARATGSVASGHVSGGSEATARGIALVPGSATAKATGPYRNDWLTIAIRAGPPGPCPPGKPLAVRGEKGQVSLRVRESDRPGWRGAIGA